MSKIRRLQAGYRKDRDSLKRLIAALPDNTSTLGLTHVTSGYIAREILEVGTISSLNICPVLREPLIYAFYGRPSFRGQTDSDPTDLTFLFPVVFLIDPAAVPPPKYVFGFDTGAFMGGLFDEYLDPNMPLFDFYLEPNVSSAARLVEYFFGGQQSFFDNTPIKAVDIPKGNFEAVSYHSLLTGGGRSGPSGNRLDDRVSTPEIIFDKPIQLGAVSTVILPHVLSEDTSISERIEASGATNLPYIWSPMSRPSEYHMIIRSQIRSIYRASSLI